MRVIAGRYRGRPLEAPHGMTTRPMTDRVKETIFNILGSRLGTLSELPPVHVLDLFAGTGGLGIEALSRGAVSCLFFERDRNAVRALRLNIEKLALQPDARIAQANAWTTRFAPPEGGYGLVFVDPPYPSVENPVAVIDLLQRLAPALAADGVIMLRHEFRMHVPLEELRGLVPVDEREIGRMKLVFLSKPPILPGPEPESPPE